jgi:hypothetical protein
VFNSLLAGSADRPSGSVSRLIVEGRPFSFLEEVISFLGRNEHPARMSILSDGPARINILPDRAARLNFCSGGSFDIPKTIVIGRRGVCLNGKCVRF